MDEIIAQLSVRFPSVRWIISETDPEYNDTGLELPKKMVLIANIDGYGTRAVPSSEAAEYIYDNWLELAKDLLAELGMVTDG